MHPHPQDPLPSGSGLSFLHHPRPRKGRHQPQGDLHVRPSVHPPLASVGRPSLRPRRSRLLEDRQRLFRRRSFRSPRRRDRSARRARRAEDGVTVRFDRQNAQGDQETLKNIAARFVSEKAKLIFAVSTPAAQAAARGAKNTPIVATAVTSFTAAKLAESEIVRYESALSVHEDTPLARVNAQSGSFVEVDAETAELTRRALEIAEETESAFEPMIGPVVELWKIGFDGSRIPSDAEISAALKLVDHRHVQIERTPEAGWRMRIAPGQKIDLGGIAKGYVGEAITERLRRAGAVRAVLDLGGNIALLGSRPDGKPWRIGLQRPDRERGSYFAVVLAEDESVITSGAYERNFTKNGKRYGHILSARTGRPVDTDLASVSIIDRDGARADALCTAFFAMGWERSSAFLKAHPDVKAVLLSKDLKRCAVSAALADRITLADKTIALETIGVAP